jgi:uncharacterized protein YkwD
MHSSIVKKCLFACLALTLGGCNLGEPGAAILSPEPLPHHPLAPGGAVLDQRVARDVISLYRQNNGLSLVANDPVLQKAAQFQANAMAQAGRLDHNVGGSFAGRIVAIGRGSSHAVENVSAGYDTFSAAFSGWRRSESHNRNLLEPHVTRMGIGTAYAPDARYKVYWALIMTD